MDSGLMTQEEIMFYNMRREHDGAWLHESPFKSVGNILHWLTVYVGLSVADTVQVGNEKITFWGKILANYSFDEEREMPIFTAEKNEDKHHNNIVDRLLQSQDLYLNMLNGYDFRNKMCIAEFGYMTYHLNIHDCDFLNNLNIGFKKIDRIHDWRNYINDHLIANWNHLTFKEKIIAYIPALRRADNEEWE